MSEYNEEDDLEAGTWKYPHIHRFDAMNDENLELVKDCFFQEKIDGSNITIQFKINDADKNLVDRTFYSRNQELEPGCKFNNIWEVVKKLESFFEDIDNYVKTKLGPEDTLMLNCEFYGKGVINRIDYGLEEGKRFSFFDCRLNGKFFSGLEFLTFQTEFLPNRERYPYWPFVISFNYGDHLAQFAELYANKQIVDIPASILTSDKSYDEIFAVIKSIKPKQNKFEGMVFKSLKESNVLYKRVFEAFSIVDPKPERKAPVVSELSEEQTKTLEACSPDYMLNCLSKRPWKNFNVFCRDLAKELTEDGFADKNADSKELIKLLMPKVKQYINPSNGSLL